MGADHVFIRFRAEVFEEEDQFVGVCPELDVSSFGDSVDAAQAALREAVEAFVEGCQLLGTLGQVLGEAGFHREGDTWVTREPTASKVLVAQA